MADPRLMLLLTAAITAVAALVLLREWRRNRAADALAWCTAALAATALAFVLFAAVNDIPDAPLRMLANYLTLAGAGALLSAARRLGGRSPSWLALVLGPTIWLAFSARIGPEFSWRVVVISLLHGSYAFATAFELARQMRGRPKSLYATTAIVASFGVFHFIRAATGANLTARQAVTGALDGGWVALVAGTTIFYVTLLAGTIAHAVRHGGQLPNVGQPAAQRVRSRVES